jgi:NO-binding membrane sensor protein with MHYT domain
MQAMLAGSRVKSKDITVWKSAGVRTAMLPESYDPPLLALSYMVALLGSYTALSIVARLSDIRGQLRVRWLFGGAFAQGTGIWGMHFTGMLALHLPVRIGYDVTLVALSFLVAVYGSLLALWLTQRQQLRRDLLVAGGLSIGGAIVGLHYISMAAMRMAALTRYSPLLVFGSMIVAVIFGLLSLWIGRRYQHDDPRRSRIGQGVAAAIMAVSISGMHYTGMAAASFYRVSEPLHSLDGLILPASNLRQAVVWSTFLILATALASTAVDRQIAARALVSRRLVAAQEGERRRIARVLHEDVGQLLTTLRLNLQRLAQPDTQDRSVVRDSIGLVDETLTHVRALSVDLRPSVLDDLGLGEAVAWYANRHAERAGYVVVVDQTLGEGRLPETVETAGFRIVQQALTNIARHAKAKNVQITLRRDLRSVEVSVVDDGIGFDVPKAEGRSRAGGSLGLVHMTELAHMTGGVLTITSTEGKGSTVRVQFPVDSVE